MHRRWGKEGSSSLGQCIVSLLKREPPLISAARLTLTGAVDS